MSPISAAARVAALALALAARAASAEGATAFSTEAYARHHDDRAVVLLAVRWSERRNCAGYDHAQLRAIGFDRQPSTHADDEAPPDVLIDDAPLVFPEPTFDHYALLLEPGEYGLSRVRIRLARSVRAVRTLELGRAELMDGGRSSGGSFRAAAGETAYVGHFFLDCSGQPKLWRYHPQDRAAFDRYLERVARAYPELDVSRVRFKLFATDAYGDDFTLP